MNQPNILITGGSGLVGSYLLRWLKQKGYSELTATFQRNDSIPQDLKTGINWVRLILPDIPDAFEVTQGKDWVIHAAGLVSYHHDDKYRLLEINKEGTEVMINACLANQVRHFIYIGSIGALGKEKNNVTLDESNPWLQNKYSTAYGLSKYLGELEVWRGAGEGLNVSVVLPSVILGTGAWQQSSLQLWDRVVNRAPFYPGGQTGYVDVRDVVKFIVMLLERNLTGDRWLLSGSNVSYGEVYHSIGRALSLKKGFRMLPKFLAGSVLQVSNLFSGRSPGMDLLNQVYGTFSYDASKSMGLDGFSYRSFQQSVEDVSEVYRNEDESGVLKFDN